MDPQRRLMALAAHKARLRRGIAIRRAACGGAVAHLAQPLAWLDRMMAFTRKLQPFALLAAVPLGLLLKRSTTPRSRLLGTLLRWGPILTGALRGLSAGRSRP